MSPKCQLFAAVCVRCRGWTVVGAHLLLRCSALISSTVFVRKSSSARFSHGSTVPSWSRLGERGRPIGVGGVGAILPMLTDTTVALWWLLRQCEMHSSEGCVSECRLWPHDHMAGWRTGEMRAGWPTWAGHGARARGHRLLFLAVLRVFCWKECVRVPPVERRE